MIKKNRIVLLMSLALWLVSCSTPKNVVYFQDAEEIRGMAVQAERQFLLRPEDKINIVVNSSDPMLVSQFNLTANTSTLRSLGSKTAPLSTAANSGSGGQQTLAYTVDEQGDINFPVLGKVSVGGKTRHEVGEYIRQRLIARDLVKDPIVTVEYVNIAVSVLGEVNRPGRIEIYKDFFTILDAIAYVGDLTINGQREKVMVSRQIDGEDHTYFINLCDKQDVLNSPAYYLQQNDVIYVAPNAKRQRDAYSTGNAFSQPYIWISLASLLATITTLLTK